MATPRVQASGPIRTDITQASELIQDAQRLLSDLERHRDLTVVACTAVARVKLTEAQRILESRGADTRPT